MFSTQHAILTNFVYAFLASYSTEKAEIFKETYQPNEHLPPIATMNKYWRQQFAETDLDTREIRDSLLDEYTLNDYLPFLTGYLFPRIRELDLPVRWRNRPMPFIGNENG